MGKERRGTDVAHRTMTPKLKLSGLVLGGTNIQRGLIQGWSNTVTYLQKMRRHLALAKDLEMCFLFSNAGM